MKVEFYHLIKFASALQRDLSVENDSINEVKLSKQTFHSYKVDKPNSFTNMLIARKIKIKTNMFSQCCAVG